MEEPGSPDVPTLEVFYERYAIVCSQQGMEPLAPDHLLTLIDALIQRTTATVN